MLLRFSEDLHYLFPCEIEVTASTVYEALYGVFSQHPLKGKLKKKPTVFVKGFTSHSALTAPTNVKEIYIDILPESDFYSGSGATPKKQGVTQILLAVAFVAVSFMLPASSAALAGSLRLTALSMAITGAMQYYTAQPEMKEDQKERKGRYFSGSKMTTEAGTPIQLILGTFRVAPQVISVNIDTFKFSGLEDLKTSVYFKEKADEAISEENIDLFYGAINAGATELVQVSNTTRTGSEF